MTRYESIQVEGSDLELNPRDVRALTECMTVLEDVGRVRGAPDLYLVVSASGKEYLVDARNGVCECPDNQKRDAHCKHARRIAFATGERPIPTWIDPDAIDANLAECVAATPRVFTTDGGHLLDERDERDNTYDERPDDCECWKTDTGLPCFACWIAGFESPASDASDEELRQ